MPKVSVVLPNYNHARFLGQRLQSVVDQTFEDFELIFLDDASTDTSLEVFEKYSSDPRIRSVLNQENSGSPFVQWNRGIDQASGDYIWIAESDDYAEPNFLETLVAAMDDNPSAGIAYVPSWIVSERNEKLRLLNWYPVFGDRGHRWKSDFVNEGRDELIRYLAIQNTIPNASATMIRRSVLDGGLRAPEHLKLCGDWLFWVRILQKSDLVYVSEQLNYFRQAHASSQRQAGASGGVEALEAFEIQKEILRAFPSERVYIRRMFNHHLRRWTSLTLHDEIPRPVDHEIHAGFLETYDLDGMRAWLKRLRLWAYYYLIVPYVRSALYRSTVGRLRVAYRKKIGVV